LPIGDATNASKQKRSFSFETVMSHPSKIDILKRAKAARFFVQLYFVGIDDPRTNIDRVALRVAQGGHDVPQDRIIARWHRTMVLLADAVSTADQAFVFDNSHGRSLSKGPRWLRRWMRRNKVGSSTGSSRRFQIGCVTFFSTTRY
jgi:predicted ABC-type ATPase